MLKEALVVLAMEESRKGLDLVESLVVLMKGKSLGEQAQ